MKFNKAEVVLLASQPSSKFEKEGVLFVREKQEGFFKRNEGELEDESQIMEAVPVKTIFVLTSLLVYFSLFLFYFNSISARLQGGRGGGPSLMCVGGTGRGNTHQSPITSILSQTKQTAFLFLFCSFVLFLFPLTEPLPLLTLLLSFSGALVPTAGQPPVLPQVPGPVV